MDLIVDIQGFKRPGNYFVLKELAVVSVRRNIKFPSPNQEQKLARFVFEPPVDFEDLTSDYKSVNSWLTKNYHGLKWNIGDYPYHKIRELLKELIKDCSYLYVKGDEKKKWLEKMTDFSIPIIDFQNWGCKSIQCLQKVKSCSFHQLHSMTDNYVCAYENVQALKLWYLEYSGMAIRSFSRSTNILYEIRDISKLDKEDILELPINYLIDFESHNIHKIWDKLPYSYKIDNRMKLYQHCKTHEEKNKTLIIDCKFCNINKEYNLPTN